jgi:hypothetical protein
MSEPMKSKTPKELLAETLAAKRAANLVVESARDEAVEIEDLERQIAIEDKRAEAYTMGILPEQLLEPHWPALGRCLARTPSEAVYRDFAKTSGMLRGELVNSLEIHEKLVLGCMLVPDGKSFLEQARKRNPHAIVQFGSAMIERMKGKLNEEGK